MVTSSPVRGQTDWSHDPLLTYDWQQLQTERGMLDITKTPEQTEAKDYHTVTFLVTNTSQYEALVSGKVMCNVQNIKTFPLDFIPGTNSHSFGSERPRTAVVKNDL